MSGEIGWNKQLIIHSLGNLKYIIYVFLGKIITFRMLEMNDLLFDRGSPLPLVDIYKLVHRSGL